MEKMSLQAPRTSSTVPLARDSEGNPIDVPEGAAGWRIRRQTGGRPRQHLDGRKQPMIFPLDYTMADAEDILPPGSYLLDAVGKAGDPLGMTVGLAIGAPRGSEAAGSDDGAGGTSALPASSSDVRLVLEANVRATQMAFLHNQRTLELALRMAEALRDGVQILASSQADWIRSVSSAGALRHGDRNDGEPVPAPARAQTEITPRSP